MEKYKVPNVSSRQAMLNHFLLGELDGIKSVAQNNSVIYMVRLTITTLLARDVPNSAQLNI